MNCSSWSACRPESTVTACLDSCPEASSSASAWPGRWPPVRRSCSWTSRSALDPLTRVAIQDEFRRIHDRLGLTTLMVTHDMTEALLMANRIAVLDGGRLVQVGTPQELMTHPAGRVVARLMDTPKRQADRLEAIAAGEGG